MWDQNRGREQMDNINPKRKQKVKKVARLGMGIAWIAVDWLV